MPETRQRPEHGLECPCGTCIEARIRRRRSGPAHERQQRPVFDEERLRLLLVIDAEAGSEHADREAERLGLTIQLRVARERRAVRGDGA